MAGPYYTVEEANAVLPRVRELVDTILKTRERVLARESEIWPALEKAVTNGGNQTTSDLVAEFDTIRRCTQQLRDLRVFIKDINTGLVDFLAERDGRDVYLCWRYDEPEVAHWHTLEGGFAGRQQL